MLTRYLRLLAFATYSALAFSIPVAAHHVNGNVAAPRASAPGPRAETVTLQGSVDQIVVENRIAGTALRIPVLAADDGRRFTLVGPSVDTLDTGTPITVTGKQDGRALFPDSLKTIGAADSRRALTKAASATSFTGILRLGHADNIDGSPSEFFFALDSGDGPPTRVELAAMLGVLTNGMRVTINGRIAADGALVADRIAIVAMPETTLDSAVTLAAPVTSSYLVLPIKFPTGGTGTLANPWTYGADPFTPVALNTAVFGATSSAKAYYNEVSYGQQLLSGIVADNGTGGFLLAQVAKPATCDIGIIASAAEAAATARGYNVASYAGLLYVFNNVSGCGWAGLAYVGWKRAYSNSTTNLLVIVHELGHNFGLAHAASLDCGANVIGGTCTSSEYGDPFDVMGNNRTMHFNAAQKAELNWIAPATVTTHTAGTTTYTLTPIETGGAARYAVKVPAAANRTYWIEYRQPIGFDSGLSSYPNNGAQIRVAAPFESLCSGCYDDTEFLDMTPATTAFTDGTLVAGQTYTDSTYNIAIKVISATASALTVEVKSPGGTAATTTTQTSSLNPAAVGSGITFTASVTAANGTTLAGNVSFTEGGASIAGCVPVPLTGTGNTRTASCATASLSAGTHNVVAVYGGDAVNATSQSAPIAQVVKANSTSGLASSLNPSPAATSVTFTASVTGIAPTGSVNFTSGGNTITGCGARTLSGSGNTRTATCATAALAVGSNSIAAIYAGDSGNAGSSSPALSQVVTASTTTGLAGTPNPSMLGGAVSFTATVNGNAPTGNVSFTDGGTSISGCSAVALSGSGNTRTATCPAAALAVGGHSIVATYAGDSANAGSSSSAMTQVVMVNSATTVVTSLTPSSLGNVVIFTATVTGNAPTGNVNFKDGSTSIANCAMAPLTGSGNSRTASCSTTGLAVGSHDVTAVYAGDATNVGSASTVLTQDVIGAETGAPTLQTAMSRKTHGAAGVFDLSLSLVSASPSTEPRVGPAATVVMTFNKPLTGATVAVIEGAAAAGAPTISGNDVVVDLTGVADQQYVTISLTNVASVDGFAGGSGSVRIGFLAGDINQSRVVTLSDSGTLNAQLSQPVTISNFLLDINASGTLTLADKGVASANLTKALSAP